MRHSTRRSHPADHASRALTRAADDVSDRRGAFGGEELRAHEHALPPFAHHAALAFCEPMGHARLEAIAAGQRMLEKAALELDVVIRLLRR